MKEKNLPLAIGLNLLLPGVGYMYMGKWIVGIAAFLLILAMYASASLTSIGLTWLLMNLIMAIDMIILGKKNQQQVRESTMMKCPSCAEMIQKEARLCRYCSTSLEAAAG